MTQYPETEENKHKIDASNWTREDGSVMNRWEYVFYNRRRMSAALKLDKNQPKSSFSTENIGTSPFC